MTALEYHVLVVLLPLTITNILHMLVVKWNLLQDLAQPISLPALGKGKTWRGFLFVTIVNGLVLWLLSLWLQLHLPQALGLGMLLGFAYILFELPNSYMKRRLGIPSGSQHPKHAWLFSIIDKTDSAFGVMMVYYLVSDITLAQAITLFLVSSCTHILLSFLMVSLKLKSSF
ncbi:MAG TPA: CDP-archaeol synthase [Cytophagales bacterium]|nr:CDP-archaeol synthase [Cytophagales bacterium]